MANQKEIKEISAHKQTENTSKDIEIIIHMSSNDIDKNIEDIDFGLVDMYANEILDEYRISGEKYCPCYTVGYSEPAMDELRMAHLLADAVDQDLYINGRGFAMNDIKYQFVVSGTFNIQN